MSYCTDAHVTTYPPKKMKPDLLHVITCVSNPAGWKSRIALYKKFEKHMLESGVRLTTVELAYGDRPFEIDLNPGVNHVRVRASTVLWSKENLLNIGEEHLPPEAKYVGWFDADIEFVDPDWAAKTIHALQQYTVVQPFDYCLDLGPTGEVIETHHSFCKLFWEGRPIQIPPQDQPFAHPGYAWATTRKFWKQVGGLIDNAILGAADHHMAMGLIGRVEESIRANVHPNYIAEMVAWQQKALPLAGKHISFVPGAIHHFWHGSKIKRNYLTRWDILANHQFDPLTDIHKNWQGVLELNGNKPDMRLEIDRYFRLRDEDGTTL